MTRDDIIDFVGMNPVFFLATTDGETPSVRAMALFRASPAGFFFAVDSSKPVCGQLEKNPRVEMCFHDPRQGLQIRIAGSVEDRSDDAALMDQAIDKYPELGSWLEESDSGSLSLYCLPEGTAKVWSPKDPFAADEIVEV